MKIKKNITKKIKLFKLNFLKAKVIKQKHVVNNLTLEDIEARFKKALRLIYSYHINNKKIMFVGNPLIINKKLLKLFKTTRHIFIPQLAWIAGVITNQRASFKSILKKNDSLIEVSQKLIQLKNKCDLIVIIDKPSDQLALDEGYLTRVPLIALNCDLNFFDIKTNYKVPGNFIKQKQLLHNNFFYLLLLSLFKKAKILKQKFLHTKHVLSTLIKIKKPKPFKKRKNYYFSK
jgi:hypothetical protein